MKSSISLEDLNIDTISPNEPISSEQPTSPVQEPTQLEASELLGKSSTSPEETPAVPGEEAEEDFTDRSNLFHAFTKVSDFMSSQAWALQTASIIAIPTIQ